MALWEALQTVAAGRACWIPRPEPELSPEAEQLVAVVLKDADRAAERLRAEAAGKLAA